MRTKDSSSKRNLKISSSSHQIVSEFFSFALASILLQRGLYSQDVFESVKMYGMTLYACRKDTELSSYISQIISQVRGWLNEGIVSRLVLCLIEKETLVVRERWQFEIELTNAGSGALQQPQLQVLRDVNTNTATIPTDDTTTHGKSEKELHQEMAALIRQITACVSFLPILPDNMTFNVLAYTDRHALGDKVPDKWIDSDAKLISNPEQVKLREFATDHHRVGGLVAYLVPE